jgi:hypothetical protein
VAADTISEMLRLPGRILPEPAESATAPMECVIEANYPENAKMEMAHDLS